MGKLRVWLVQNRTHKDGASTKVDCGNQWRTNWPRLCALKWWYSAQPDNFRRQTNSHSQAVMLRETSSNGSGLGGGGWWRNAEDFLEGW